MEGALLNSLPLRQARVPFRLIAFITPPADASSVLPCTGTTRLRCKLVPHVSFSNWGQPLQCTVGITLFRDAFRPGVSNWDLDPSVFWKIFNGMCLVLYTCVPDEHSRVR